MIFIFQFVCIFPSSVAPAASGQLWLLKNYTRHDLSIKIQEYLEYIQKSSVSEEFEVLEIVPISALCGMLFL